MGEYTFLAMDTINEGNKIRTTAVTPRTGHDTAFTSAHARENGREFDTCSRANHSAPIRAVFSTSSHRDVWLFMFAKKIGSEHCRRSHTSSAILWDCIVYILCSRHTLSLAKKHRTTRKITFTIDITNPRMDSSGFREVLIDAQQIHFEGEEAVVQVGQNVY